MAALKIRGMAVLIGYTSDGKCVYSDIVDIHDYYDNAHPWDDAKSVKKLGLSRVTGFLFGPDGALDQEFETFFDAMTGLYKSSKTRFADGSVQNGPDPNFPH
jgi:hypothetical protein